MSARIALGALAAAAALAGACGRSDRTSPKELQQQIATLEAERDSLLAKLDTLMAADPIIQGMPTTPVRVGVPTSLAEELITKVVSGFVDQVTLELKNLKVKKTGTVKKVVSIGQYDLQVQIHKVTGRLKTGRPEMKFGGNKVSLELPVRVVSGSGRATIDFKWDGKNFSGAVCGDMEVQQEVTGGVKPASYPVAGALLLSATTREILAAPQFPTIKVNLKVEPSTESWAAVEKILEDKEGVCGYVVEKVNVLRIVQALIERAGLPERFAKLRGRTLAPKHGAERIATFGDGGPDAWRGRVGFGQVLVLPFDPTYFLFRDDAALKDFWRPLLEETLDLRAPEEQRNANWYQWNDPAQQRRSVAVERASNLLLGNVPGVVLGAVLLTALPEALRYAAPLQQQWLNAVYVEPADLRMLLFGLALVLMMLLRPAGLWPSRTRRRELAEPLDEEQGSREKALGAAR